jgi:hypothetical protein
VLALVASGLADGCLPVVLSFAVLQTTGSPARLGLVLASQSAAALLVTLAGGLAGDRFPRGRIMTASLLTRMAAAAAMAAALATGTASFTLLLVMAGAYGCADGFFSPASTAFLPSVVSPAQLAPVNALTGGTGSAAAIAAPALAGLITAVFGAGAGFAGQAAMLAVAAGGLAAARLPDNRAAATVRLNPLRQLRTGWAEFVRHQWLWLLTAQWTVFSLVILAPVAVLGPVIAERHLGGASAWGAVSSCLALGGVGGQLAAGRSGRPARPAFVIGCLVPVMTAEALALGLGAPLAVVALAAVVTGAAMGAQNVIFQTAMQTSVAPAVLARVTAIDLLGSEGGQPVGYALAGPAGAAVGANTLLAVSAVGTLIAATTFAFLRPLRATIRGG